MKRRIPFLMIWLLAFLAGCSGSGQTEKLFQHFIDRHVERIKPIIKSQNEATWAAYTGRSSFNDLVDKSLQTDSLYQAANQPPEYYQRLLNGLYDNESDFEILMKIKNSGLIHDPILKRQFGNLFRNFIFFQRNWDETEKKQAVLFDQFYELKRKESLSFDKEVSDSARRENKNQLLFEYAGLTGEFKEVIRSLNEDVRSLGYDNYYDWVVQSSDISWQILDSIIRMVDEETRDDYRKLLDICNKQIELKQVSDSVQITSSDYQLEHVRMISPIEWSQVWTQEESIRKIRDFYSAGNYPIDDIILKSDLWYDRGKINNCFFFCLDHERKDFRIYANARSDLSSFLNLIHEFGHAVHYMSVSDNVPYFLKDPHPIVTEAIALYFDGKLYTSPKVHQKLGLPALDENGYYTEFSNPSRLLFLRKLIRNIQFERQIYLNPEQDFNELWWNLNRDYLFFDLPSVHRIPEWSANNHIMSSSGFHIYYLLAMLVAAQLEAYYPEEMMAPVQEKFMKFGDMFPWHQLIEKATGESLNLRYLIYSYKKEGQKEGALTINAKFPDDSQIFEEFHFKTSRKTGKLNI